MLKQSVLRRMQYWQDYKVCEFFHYVHMIKNGHLVASMAHRILTLFFFQCKLLIGHLCVKLIENTYIILKNVSLSHKSFLFNITMRDVNQEARRYSYNVFRLRFQL